MRIKELLETMCLPNTYEKSGKSCYFDAYRKRLIEITPEETVRQQVLGYIEKYLNVPNEMISVEVPMSYYKKKTPGRADIIIHKIIDEEWKAPLAVIECKNNEIFLTDNVAEQGIRYSDIIGADYVFITNGNDIEVLKYDENTQKYDWQTEIPDYEKMLDGRVTSVNVSNIEAQRLVFEQLHDENIIQEFNDYNIHWVFGKDTKLHLRSMVVNLYQCIMDEKHILPSKKFDNFEVIKDIGLRYMDYGNAGGGHYLGFYRAFLVKDKNNDAQVISMSLFGTDPDFRNEGRNSYTSLVVAIDKGKVSHNVLQYNMDRFSICYNKNFEFIHNGSISARKSEELRNYVGLNSKRIIINENIIQLGKLTDNKLLYLDDSELSEFMYNLIEYCLLREAFRKE